MENFYYIKVADKGGEAQAASLLEKLQEGYMVANATGSNGCVHYILFLPLYSPAGDEEHELDEEEMKIIEDNIEIGMKGIKKRNGES